MWKVSEMFHDVLRNWIGRLYQAEITGIRDFRQQVQYVMNECKSVNEQLATMPIHPFEHFTPVLVGMFLTEISAHHNRDREFRRITRHQDELHNAVCTEMLLSVLLPSTTRHNTIIQSSFQQILVIRTFNLTRNLTHLAFTAEGEIDNSALLASNIHHLIHLLSFEYKYHCTDKVIEQLSLHCSKLKKLDVSYSLAVSNESINHLVELQDLNSLKVMDTSMSSESYGLLMSALTKITNIHWLFPVCGVLYNTVGEMFQSITYVWGPITNCNILTQKCPYVRVLILLNVYEDLSSLTTLNMLTDISIHTGAYNLCNMRVVLEGVGHRLEDLEFQTVDEVCIADIITLCSCLKVLILEYCTCDPANLNTVMRRDHPHFSSLRKINITGNEIENDLYYRRLRYYVNLEMFVCNGVNNLSDDFISRAVENGAFKNIEYFEVDGTDAGVLSINTVYLLLNNSNDLECVGRLGTWSNVTPESINELEASIQLQNIDLEILVD
jgi:hypothetical protein